MSDPITLSAAGIGAVALTEGVKFLYAQAGEILKRWMTRKDAENTADKSSDPEEFIIVTPPPGVFDREMSRLPIHFAAVRDRESQLRALYRELSEYVSGIVPVNAGNDSLLESVDKLRTILEDVSGQHITFNGEQRPVTGTSVLGIVRASVVAGEATGVDIEGQVMGDVKGGVETGTVEKGGKAVGVKLRL